MQSLVESIRGTKILNERYSKKDEQVFWQWIEDLGGTECIDTINKGDRDGYKGFYKLVMELGTTEEEFALFCEIFMDKAGEMLDIIMDDDPGMGDDGCQYASWTSPFYGKKKFEQALKNKEWSSICDEYEGEHCGYAMEDYAYSEYLEELDIKDSGNEPTGYAR